MTYVPVASTIDELTSLFAGMGHPNEVPLNDALKSLILSIATVAKGNTGATGATGAAGATGATGAVGFNLTALAASPSYADDAAAATGGIAVSGVYLSGSTIKIRVA